MGKGGRPFKVHEDLVQISSAVELEDLNTIKSLVKNHGIDAYDPDKRTLLIWAAFYNKLALLNWLIEHKAHVNQQDKSGYTGLHFATQEKNEEVIRLLLTNHADPNLIDSHGNSPLWTAIFNAKGDFEIVKLLMSSGADPQHKNKYDRSPDDMAKSIYGKEINELIK
ncbi:ankyrin repeat protein [Catalinimonas alkaloidigena]|uniref:ankyrin repeat domain-containing protein n=1 Tax=Catalinimonas alkaloidigena TaxID=1075417 RepID=UPI002406551D|nr:ankyrin repeat domain-containing protein [Catalinimonas alkaloidigena]MDF9796329.1 ankyrin repeat protein [Catalinimonas alkaloidigena]